MFCDKLISMNLQPVLETPRLLLRPFSLCDAPAVQTLAGAREVAAVTIHVPHPYEDGMAEAWIATHQSQWDEGRGANFAIVRREDGVLMGTMGLGIEPRFRHADLGYWLGVPFWKCGYATEAARAVVGFGFDTLNLHRVHASHFACNPASGRVMEKIGMQWEGCLRGHALKWGEFHDLVKRGILASEWK
jgi:RimJ/RimL family protein N-acetyltransferase